MRQSSRYGFLFAICLGVLLGSWLLVPERKPRPDMPETAPEPSITGADGGQQQSITATQERQAPAETAPIQTTPRPELPRYEMPLPDLARLRMGDLFELEVPHENTRYTGVVEDVSQTDAVNTTLIGVFPVDGTRYRFVFTLGKIYTFGTIHTPRGRYQLEGQGGRAEIVATRDINQRRDYSIPDYVKPSLPDPRASKTDNLSQQESQTQQESGST